MSTPSSAPDARAAAGGADHQRPLRAERRQRALGQPLRRPLRHRRHRRGRRRDAGAGLQSGARRQGDRPRQGGARHGRAAGERQPCRRDRLRGRRPAPWSCRTPAGDVPGSPSRRGSPAIAARPTALGDPAAMHGLHLEIVIDRAASHRQRRPGRGRRRDPGSRRSAPSSTARTPSPRSTPRTRSLRLSQLAGPDEGRPERRPGKGRPDIERRLAPDRATPSRTAASWCCPAARCCSCATSATTCTPTRCWTRTAQPIPEGFLDALVTSTAALHDLQRERAVPQQPRGLGLYRQAEDARARRGRLHAIELFARVEAILGLPENTLKIGVMDEERRTSANLAACIHAARHGSSSSTPAFSTAPATRSTPPWRAGRWCARPRCGRRPGSRPTRTAQRRDRPGRGPEGQGADRQGHVGRARPHGRHAGAEDRPPEEPAPPPPGCRRRRRRPCTRCTITRSTCRSARTSWPARRSRAWTAAHARRWRSAATSRPDEVQAGAGRQYPEHPGLRGALGRPGRRLLQGARTSTTSA